LRGSGKRGFRPKQQLEEEGTLNISIFLDSIVFDALEELARFSGVIYCKICKVVERCWVVASCNGSEPK
jgi:hypothetical protein